MRYLRYMLIFVPIAVFAEFVLHDNTVIFLTSALALIPLAGLLGEATEELAIHTGPRIGGLLNATLGNAAFETEVQDPRLNIISMGVAAILIVVYVLSLIYQLRGPGGATTAHADTNHSTPASTEHSGTPGTAVAHNPGSGARVYETAGHEEAGRSHTGVSDSDDIVHHTAKWSVGTSLGILAGSTLAIVFMSEFLVGVVEPVATALGVRELFLGVIVVPIVGNVAEHLVGVTAAMKNQMDLSMTISLGSSMQIALFVAPLLVFVSLLFGPELTLFFSLFEVMVLGLSVLIAAFISVDGESNWLEGAMLLAVYVIAGFGFFYL